jgi:hypothetical protein
LFCCAEINDTIAESEDKNMHTDQFDQQDEQDEPTFERVRKQTGKNVKGGDRRQKDKEWGRTIKKFHKQRQRYDGNKGKP